VLVAAPSPQRTSKATGVASLGEEKSAMTFPNVIIAGHQAFFMREALLNIAVTTIENITKFENDQPLENVAG
jgi:lactate dehydrogenase-like 2-hydroxyacid dehydrogenase